MDNVVMGNLCQDPTLYQPKRTAQPVAKFTVAVNKWRKDGTQFVQRAPVFHRVVCFGPLAENVSNSLRKGMEVLAVGEWVDDTYTDEQGQRRVQFSMEAKAVGPTLRWAVAKVQKVDRRTDRDEPPLLDKPGGTSPPTTTSDTAAPAKAGATVGTVVGMLDVARGTSPVTRGKHELITDNDSSGDLAPVEPLPTTTTELPARRRGGLHRRKEAEPESTTARAS